MPPRERHHRWISFLRRAGAILGTFSAILALLSLRPHAAPGPNFAHSTEPTQPQIPAADSIVAAVSGSLKDGEIQVAVAEVHALSSDDWSRLLSQLAADLRLGLMVEVQLPATTSPEGPPGDPLNRLMWAKQALRGSRIELKVERGIIRVIPLPAADEPLEAFHQIPNFERLPPLGTQAHSQITSFASNEPGTIL